MPINISSLLWMIFSLIILIAQTISLCHVQRNLSMKSKWKGWILPIVNFLLMPCIGILYFGYFVSICSPIMNILIFVILNIPTVIYIIIYYKIRKKNIQKSDMYKMSIQDL